MFPEPQCQVVNTNTGEIKTIRISGCISSLGWRVSVKVQIGSILTYFLLKECSNNDYIEGKNTIASISTSLPLPRIFIFIKIDVSNVINKSITVETNKCPQGNYQAMGEASCSLWDWDSVAEGYREIFIKFPSKKVKSLG